jgi:uncharacterized protein (TIGR02391 family)
MAEAKKVIRGISDMQEYKHILIDSEIKSGRIYIAESALEEFRRSLGQVQSRPFNIFRSDGKLLARAVSIQKRPSKRGWRLSFGLDTFAGCTEGTPIWLRLRPDGDVEVQIGPSAGPIADAELSQECLATLENPKTDNYWQAVTAACIILESRLRNRTQAPSDLHTTRLVDHALRYADGKLICRTNRNEQEGINQLCQGVMRALRNPSTHEKQNLSRTRAHQIVGIIDLLLGEIDQAEVRKE